MRVVAALIGAMLALSGCTSAGPATRHSPSPSPPTMQNSDSPTAARSAAGVSVDKVLVIIEENQSAAEVAATMPFFRSQSRRYGTASHYYALTHPSLPNYLAVAGGSTFGIADDHGPAHHPLSGSSVFAQVLSAGHTAKTYAEGMPGNCAVDNHGSYAVRHNPWTYFADPAERAACHRFDVPAGTPQSGALAHDVRAGQLPTFALLVPDVCHDGHDCSAAVTDAWLADWLPTLQDGPDFRSGRLAIVVTWDEDDNHAGNHIPLTILHPSLHGKTVDARLDHLALSAAISRLAGKPPLRAARDAPDLLEQFGL